jgi:hypothetical protein
LLNPQPHSTPFLVHFLLQVSCWFFRVFMIIFPTHLTPFSILAVAVGIFGILGILGFRVM